MKKIFLFLFAMFFIINQATAQSYSAEDLFNDRANVTALGYKAIDLDNVKKLSRCIHTKGVLTGT